MAYKRKAPKYPSEYNGLLTTVKKNGRLPDVDTEGMAKTTICVILNDIVDEVDTALQMRLYRIMRKASEAGMIIVVDHSLKKDHVLYTMELYLGKPSPVLTQIFREQAGNIDIDEILSNVEEKSKGDDDEDKTL